MNIEQKHIDHIRKGFANLQTKEDLVKLLSEAKILLYGKKCKPVQLKSLTYYANPNICKTRYSTFTIKKKSGAERTINAPVKGLKSILRALNFVLQCVYEPHEAATGFVLNKSIVDNAKKHVGHHYVLNLDLKDFFHSFDRNRVKMAIWYDFFNLDKDKEPLAFLLASVSTHPFEIDGVIKTVLPQGSPTSPTLTNVLCKKLDRRLNGLANRFGITYTRYADDITFSSPHNIYTDEAFNKELKRIIEEDQKLMINPKKTRLQKAGHRQEVTGLIVNDKVNVHRRYVKQLRMWLYYWEKYGYEKAKLIFRKDYKADKGHVKKTDSKLESVIDGKLEFLKMVKGAEDSTYQKLKERFDILTSITNPMNQLLDIWEEEGISKAMEFLDTINKLGMKKSIQSINTIINFKSKFITDILDYSIKKKVDNKTKERLIKLIGNEFEKAGIIEIEIIERLSRIEEMLSGGEELKQKEKGYQRKLHKPKETKNFLSLFNNSEGLKYLTHKFNDGKRDYHRFIELCKQEFEGAKQEYKNTPIALLTRIEEFAFSENPKWYIRKGKDKIYPEKGWSEKSFIKWYKNKINIHPGLDAKWNNEMIVPFKETIEVRAGNLTEIIDEAIKLALGESKDNFIINMNDKELNLAEFYTDVDMFQQAIFHIISTIKDRAEKNFCFEIKIGYNNKTLEGGDFKIITITHINSEATKKSNDPSFAKGDLKTIQNNLWGLCNYEINAKFPNGIKKKLFLTDNYRDYKEIIEKNQSIDLEAEVVEGFSHILKFY